MSCRKQFFINLQRQTESISANKDFTRIVVAGNKLLRIFAFENDNLNYALDLKDRRSHSEIPNSSTNSSLHVVWSPVIDKAPSSYIDTWTIENANSLIATATTSGLVALWNTEKAALEHLYKTHSRSVSKVCFHQSDKNLLISGLKDGCVVLYDLRLPKFTAKFISKFSSDPVRDVQFGLHTGQTDVFVVADDGGSMHFWDLRRSDRPLREFVAHHGPASIALNPSYEDRNVLATAGRDKFIRVWKWCDWHESNQSSAIYSVETTTSVSRVRWRPLQKFHVTSCSFVNDTNIHIWDIRRPFLPIGSFDIHRELCCDLMWKPDDSNVLISAVKNGFIGLHFFENADRPLNHVNDVAIDISPSGEIAIALSSHLKQKIEALDDIKKIQRGEAVPRRRRVYEPFQSWIPSHLVICGSKGSSASLYPNHFIQFANGYQLCGSDLQKLCMHNAFIAKAVSRRRLACTWRMIGLLCSLSPFFEVNDYKIQSDNRRSSNEDDEDASSVARSRFSSNKSSGGIHNIESEDFNNFSTVSPELAGTADFFFGEGEVNMDRLDFKNSEMNSPRNYTGSAFLKMEAFTPRLRDEFDLFDEIRSNSTEDGSTIADDCSNELGERSFFLGKLSIKNDVVSLPMWDPLPVIRSLFEYYSDLGDVQTCVSMLLVLGKRTAEFIDIALQKLWFLDYIGMLERFELWTVSAEIIKLCWIPSVNNLSNENTFVRLLCTNCQTPSFSTFSQCKKCDAKFQFICSVCCQPVRGLWMWCRGCRHGGHPNHFSEWFSTNELCATGCGHRCK